MSGEGGVILKCGGSVLFVRGFASIACEREVRTEQNKNETGQ